MKVCIPLLSLAALSAAGSVLAAPAPPATDRVAAMQKVAASLNVDLAAMAAAERQVLAQQAAQQHQAQLLTLRASLPAPLKTLSGARLGAVPAAALGLKPATLLIPPLIRQMSVTEGDPGTPVLLSGEGFGDSSGEVHLLLPGGRDVKATTSYWSAGIIETQVPYTDGIGVTDGQVYVLSSDGHRSPAVSFRFRPVLDFQVLGMPPRTSTQYNVGGYLDSTVWMGIAGPDTTIFSDGIARGSSVLGFSGDDEFYKTSTLKNGWTVKNCSTKSAGQVQYSVNVSMCSTGKSNLYTKIHWTLGGVGLNAFHYTLLIGIVGPKGVPYN
jgi:hypothetical protein